MKLTHNIWIDGTSGWSQQADSEEREIARVEADLAVDRNGAPRHADGEPEKRTLEQERDSMAPAMPVEHGHGAGSRPALEEARTDSGVYRGKIVGVIKGHIVQQIGPSLILHDKDKLSRTPPVGDSVIVQYSNGRGVVKDAPLRARTMLQDLGR